MISMLFPALSAVMLLPGPVMVADAVSGREDGAGKQES